MTCNHSANNVLNGNGGLYITFRLHTHYKHNYYCYMFTSPQITVTFLQGLHGDGGAGQSRLGHCREAVVELFGRISGRQREAQCGICNLCFPQDASCELVHRRRRADPANMNKQI
jgi:hypothetical protein